MSFCDLKALGVGVTRPCPGRPEETGVNSARALLLAEKPDLVAMVLFVSQMAALRAADAGAAGRDADRLSFPDVCTRSCVLSIETSQTD